MKTFFVILFIFFVGCGASLQHNDTPQAKVYSFAEVTTKPHPIHITTPDYPQFAKQKKITGTVKLYLVINENGSVESAKFVDGPNVFKESALRAAKTFKFKPGKLNDEAVKVYMVMPMNFELNVK